jgi:hypothetical protein
MLVALGSCLYSEASWSMYSVPVPTQTTAGVAGDGKNALVAGTFNYDTSRVAGKGLQSSTYKASTRALSCFISSYH